MPEQLEQVKKRGYTLAAMLVMSECHCAPPPLTTTEAASLPLSGQHSSRQSLNGLVLASDPSIGLAVASFCSMKRNV